MCFVRSKLSVPPSQPLPQDQDQLLLSDASLAELIALDKWNSSTSLFDIIESSSCLLEGFTTDSSANIDFAPSDFTTALLGIESPNAFTDYSPSVSSPQSTLFNPESNSTEITPVHSPAPLSPHSSPETLFVEHFSSFVPETVKVDPDLQFSIPTILLTTAGDSCPIQFPQLMPQTERTVEPVTVYPIQNIQVSPATPALTTSSASSSHCSSAANSSSRSAPSSSSKRSNSNGGSSHSRKARKRSSSETEEELDEVTLKRMRNTEAARRSRMRKMQKMESLEQRVKELETENAGLCVRVAVLESEKVGWMEKELELTERIKKLEEQLLESHQAMLSMGLKVEDL